MRHPRLLLAVVMLLAGCSALQIDVDVYKGPLVNNEEMQRDQLISMAMSAKGLMFTARNRILDRHFEHWDQRCPSQPRQRVLRPSEWDHEARGGGCVRAPSADERAMVPNAMPQHDQRQQRQGTAGGDADAPSTDVGDAREQAWRNARQFNAILSFFEPLAPRALREEVLRVQEDWAAVVASRPAGSARAPAAAIKPTLQDAELQQSLVELLVRADSARADPALAEEAGEIMRIAARGIADSIKGNTVLELPSPCGLSIAEGARAMTLEHCLVRQTRDTVALLAKRIQSGGSQGSTAATAESIRRSGVSQWTSILNSWQPVRRLIDPAAAAQGYRPAPIPEGAAADANESAANRNFERSMQRLMTLDASGFDAGRVPEGIDRLADNYTAARDAWIRDGKPSARARDAGARAASAPDGPARASTGRGTKEAADDAFARLEHMLSDMAGRMQFLATNLWLIDNAHVGLDEEIGGIKEVLETVANTIIVHADDLIRQRQFLDSQRNGAADRERRAVQTVTGADANAGLRQLMDRLERRVRQAEAAASASEGAAGQRQKALAAARSQLGESNAKLEKLKEAGKEPRKWDEPARALAQLLRLSVPAVSGAKPEAGTETFRRDLEAVKVASASNESLREELTGMLNLTLKREHASPATKDSPRAKRIEQAKQYLAEYLNPMSDAQQARAKALKAFIAELGTRVKQTVEASGEVAKLERAATADVKLLEERIAGLEKEEAIAAKSIGGGRSLSELTRARATVRAQRADVESRIARAEGEHDVLGLFESAINDAVKNRGLTSEDANLALAMLAELPAPTRLQVPEASAQARDVLDDVITQYRYRYLEALRTLGPDHPTTRQTELALEKARRQREDTLYLRSATAYLRSAVPMTKLQEGVRLRWSNMLLANAVRSPAEFIRWIKGGTRDEEIREALDRAHWQNINTVRLSGGGESNFVVAKDDVGNWYVKAMGADAAAMARAAKQLALFNSGARFDTDLLRVDELRSQIDSGRRNNTSTQAQEEELRTLRGPGGRAGAGARSDTLALFTKNYNDQSLRHLKDLAARLQSEAPLSDVKKRWAESLKETANPAVLNGLTESELVRKHYEAGTESVEAESATQKPGAAVLAALEHLQRARLALASAVQSSMVLTAREATAVESAKAERDRQQALLADAVKDEQSAADLLLDLGRKHGAARAAGRIAEADQLVQQLEAARTDHEAKLAHRRKREAELEDRRKTLGDSDKALLLAKSLQARAIDDVSKVFSAFVDEIVKERLRLVGETETAVKVLGGN